VSVKGMIKGHPVFTKIAEEPGIKRSPTSTFFIASISSPFAREIWFAMAGSG
jgi:hypothetical protein